MYPKFPLVVVVPLCRLASPSACCRPFFPSCARIVVLAPFSEPGSCGLLEDLHLTGSQNLTLLSYSRQPLHTPTHPSQTGVGTSFFPLWWSRGVDWTGHCLTQGTKHHQEIKLCRPKYCVEANSLAAVSVLFVMPNLVRWRRLFGGVPPAPGSYLCPGLERAPPEGSVKICLPEDRKV
ncbi:hypothetical protein BDP55DRAFT_647152, partial [Colletotrichum godetiae]